MTLTTQAARRLVVADDGPDPLLSDSITIADLEAIERDAVAPYVYLLRLQAHGIHNRDRDHDEGQHDASSFEDCHSDICYPAQRLLAVPEPLAAQADAGLDVERLRQALVNIDNADFGYPVFPAEFAADLAAEYARLASPRDSGPRT